MKTIFGSHRFALLLATLLIGLGIISAANAIVENVYRYSEPQTGYLQLPVPAFFPDDTGIEYDTSNGGRLTASAGVFRCFSAPVNLPQGAKMTDVRVWYVAVAGGDTAAGLLREDTTVGNAVAVINTSLAATGAGVRGTANLPVPAAFQSVQNVRYSYIFRFCLFQPTTRFDGARVTYTYTSAGD
jgi:hypothetical protein